MLLPTAESEIVILLWQSAGREEIDIAFGTPCCLSLI